MTTPEPGTILSASGGYDQTNCDFYRVERITPTGYLVLQPLDKIETVTGRKDSMRGEVVPGDPLPKPTIRRKAVYSGSSFIGCAIEHYSFGAWARVWHGTPQKVTHYA